MRPAAGCLHARRRRIVAAGVALIASAGLGAACSPAGAGSTSPPSSRETTTTLPASFQVGIHTFHWTDNSRTHLTAELAAAPGRVLTTEVRYPTLDGRAGGEVVDAPPAAAGRPFPVIVFAHGFITEPDDYAAMLDAWVEAGFVVVSPVFPDENTSTVDADGGEDNGTVQNNLENDVYAEPGDIVFVLRQLSSLAGQPWGSHLAGVLNLSDLALAGQSDGASVVAALGYASGFASLYRQLPSVPKAVAVMSGTLWTTTFTGSPGTYASGPASPALLQIQSDADGCNFPSAAKPLWRALEPGLSAKWFVTLFGANHLDPFQGRGRWAAVVDSVTTKFFELALRWRVPTVSAASVTRAGTVAGVATVSQKRAYDMPVVPPIGGCPS
ncbi:MAG: hypothetical protein ABSH30_08215 [Acidimicrobiales bacterium]